jgi:hypothetical protein
MDFVYVLVFRSEWEDAVIILSEEEAIKKSIQYPKNRVEVFSNKNGAGYMPTYDYYENGILIQDI